MEDRTGHSHHPGGAKAVSGRRKAAFVRSREGFTARDMFVHAAVGFLFTLPAIGIFSFSSIVAIADGMTTDRTITLSLTGMTLALAAGEFAFLLYLMRVVNRRPDGQAEIVLNLPEGPDAWRETAALYLPFAGVLALVTLTFVFLWPQHSQSALGTFRITRGWIGTAAVWLSVPVTAVTSEILYRGMGIAGYCKTGSPRRAVLWTAAVFCLMRPALSFFAFGIVLGTIRLRTKSLYCCIAVHAFHSLLYAAFGDMVHAATPTWFRMLV